MRRPTLLSPCLKQFSDFVGHSVLYTLVKFYTTTLALASLCQHFTFSAVLEGTEYIWYVWQIQTNDIYDQVQFFTFHLNFYDRQIQHQCFTREDSPFRLLPFRLLLISICQVFRQRCNIAKRHFFWRFQLLWIPSQNGHRLLHPLHSLHLTDITSRGKIKSTLSISGLASSPKYKMRIMIRSMMRMHEIFLWHVLYEKLETFYLNFR